VQNKRLCGINLNQAGQIWLIQGRIDVLILVIIKEPEKTIQPDIDARGLNHSQIERV
jgi:hypothetical protein